MSLTKEPEPPPAAEMPETQPSPGGEAELTAKTAGAAEQEPSGSGSEPETAESFWATFTAADGRNFLVTVAGTVIGGILLLVVVAVAVIIVRSHIIPGPGKGARQVGYAVWEVLALALIATFTVVIAAQALKAGSLQRVLREEFVGRDWLRALIFAVMVAASLAFVLVLLDLLGAAAGIR